MIDSLTPEQTAKFPIYTDKWVKIGLSTEPCDFSASVEAVKKIYKAASLAEPKLYFRQACPLTAAVAILVVEMYFDNFDWTSLQEDMQVNKFTKTLEEVLASMKPQLRQQMEQAVDAIPGVATDPDNGLGVFEDRWLKVVRAITHLAEADLGKRLWGSIQNQLYGNQDVWLPFYDFFNTEFPELNLQDKLEGLLALATTCGWWIATQDVVVLQDRPLHIHRDTEGRLHNLEGPAVEYRGGHVKLYTVHGVRVSEKVIKKEFTWEDIDKESNAEVRRVMLDIFGTGKYIEQSGLKEMHADDYGVLYCKEFPNDQEPLMMVKVVNSTPEADGSFKDYWLRVDPKCYGGVKTAQAAVASTWRNKDGSLVFATPEDYVLSRQT